MSRKRSQPRPLRASFPPMPFPATSDQRAASYLARLREWRRQDRTSLLHRSGSTPASSSSSTSVSAVLEPPSPWQQAERIIACARGPLYVHVSRDRCREDVSALDRCRAGSEPCSNTGKSSDQRSQAQAVKGEVRCF